MDGEGDRMRKKETILRIGGEARCQPVDYPARGGGAVSETRLDRDRQIMGTDRGAKGGEGCSLSLPR